MAADPEFRDKLRSLHLGAPRSPRSTVDAETGVRTVEVIGDDGSVAGLSHEHPDGRVDATAFARGPVLGTEH